MFSYRQESPLSSLVVPPPCLEADHAAVLAALYLRGLADSGAANRRTWPWVLRALRQGGSPLEAAEPCLRKAGLSGEAFLVSDVARLRAGMKVVRQGRVLTAADPAYPARWLRALGAAAPPALWKRGQMPARPSVTIVGSRSVPRSVWRFGAASARQAVLLGFAVASGGAQGCDSAAAWGTLHAAPEVAAAGPWECGVRVPLIEVIPCGLECRRTRRPGCALSACAPWEGFSASAAMERNALLYALSELSIVCQARYREGGSWHGAVEASRRRLCRLAVRWAPGDPAARALVSLGAFPMSSAEDLELALAFEGLQPPLIDSYRVS